jgi:hypothetical protein
MQNPEDGQTQATLDAELLKRLEAGTLVFPDLNPCDPMVRLSQMLDDNLRSDKSKPFEIGDGDQKLLTAAFENALKK